MKMANIISQQEKYKVATIIIFLQHLQAFCASPLRGWLNLPLNDTLASLSDRPRRLSALFSCRINAILEGFFIVGC